MSTGTVTINVDGAARGNPGPAAFAYVISRPGEPPIEDKGCLGHTTNNVAEYTALLRALERAGQFGGGRVVVYSDSELLVKQMNGEYRVKNEDLQLLFAEAKRLCRQFDSVALVHVPRGQNARADALCNEALDGDKPARKATPAARSKKPAVSPERRQAVRDDAVTCLKTAAAAWAKGNADQPPPEQVWDQLWSILEEQGLIRAPRG